MAWAPWVNLLGCTSSVPTEPRPYPLFTLVNILEEKDHERDSEMSPAKPADRARYVEKVQYAVRPGGHVIVATFADDGPDHCSGLEVVRYNPEGLHNEFGDGFDLVDSIRETHHTPFGTDQKFIYCYCRKY